MWTSSQWVKLQSFKYISPPDTLLVLLIKGMRKAKLLLEGEAEGKLLVWQILTNRKLSRYFQREVILQQACSRPYISHLLFYNKLPKKLATFKAISAGQEPGLGLAGCLWLRASHKAAVSPQGSKKGRFTTKLTHMAIGRPWVLIACWQKIPFPCYVGYSTELCTTWQLASPRMRTEREKARWKP